MSLRFNPPPNWPAPPPNWSPPQGWRPDPSWPPMPRGWALWVEDAPALAVDVAGVKRLQRALRHGAMSEPFGLRLDAKTGEIFKVMERKVRVPLRGAVASMEGAGQAQSRVTATRMLAVGLFAFAIPKQSSERVVFLTIVNESANCGLSVEAPGSREADAARWILAFNDSPVTGQ